MYGSRYDTVNDSSLRSNILSPWPGAVRMKCSCKPNGSRKRYHILDLYFETKYSLKYRRRGHIYCLDRLEIRISCLLRVHLHSLHRYSRCHNMHRIWHLQILCFRKPDSISIGEKCDKIHINSLHPWRSLKIQLQNYKTTNDLSEM